MNKKTKAILGGLAFVAGCEIGIAIQLYKMIRNYVIEEEARKADPGIEPDALDEAAEEFDAWTDECKQEDTEEDVHSELQDAQPDPVPGV